MPSRWPQIRVTASQKTRLERLAAEHLKAHSEGRIVLPTDYAVYVPLHHVIERLLDEVESRRERSRRPHKKP